MKSLFAKDPNNPFARQLMKTLFDRLQRRDFPVILLKTQYRMHCGLSKLSSALFYDVVLANKREKIQIGFVKDPKRTTVAVTRCLYMRIIVCDVTALDISEKRQETIDDMEYEQRARLEERTEFEQRYIKKMINTYKSEGMVHIIADPRKLDDAKLIDWKPLDDYLAQKNSKPTCRNCLKAGHVERDCTACKDCGQDDHQQEECTAPENLLVVGGENVQAVSDTP